MSNSTYTVPEGNRELVQKEFPFCNKKCKDLYFIHIDGHNWYPFCNAVKEHTALFELTKCPKE